MKIANYLQKMPQKKNNSPDACVASCRHATKDFDCIVRHAKVGIDPVMTILELGMAEMQIFAGSSRAAFATDGLLHLLQLYAHVVDIGVDGDEVHVLVLLRS